MSELYDLRLDRLEEDMRDIKPALARLEPNDCQHQCAIAASGDKGRGLEAADVADTYGACWRQWSQRTWRCSLPSRYCRCITHDGQCCRDSTPDMRMS